MLSMSCLSSSSLWLVALSRRERSGGVAIASGGDVAVEMFWLVTGVRRHC